MAAVRGRSKAFAVYVMNEGTHVWIFAGVYRSTSAMCAMFRFCVNDSSMFPNAESLMAKPYNEKVE